MKFLWSLLLVPLIAVSCSKSSSQSESNQLQELQQRVNFLELAGQREFAPKWVVINPTAKTYQKISTSVLPLLIKSQDATPYLDGYKIKIALGNPYLVKFSGFTLTARWDRQRLPNFGKPSTFSPPPLSSQDETPLQTDEFGGVLVSTQHFDPTKPDEAIKSSTVQQYTDELSQGSWTKIELIITPATVEDLKNLRIAIDLNVLSLPATSD
jgi:hypothetical protein